MTVIQFVLLAITTFIMFAGLFMVIRSIKRQKNADIATISYDKNGIPIIPRHERHIVDSSDWDDAAAGETTISPNRDYLSAVVDDEPVSASTTVEVAIPQHQSNDQYRDDHDYDSDEDYRRWQAEQQREDDSEFAHLADEMRTADANEVNEPPRQTSFDETDAFSDLMSATDNLMPAIDTSEAPSFTNSSPILDQHLLESANQAQNAPLINARDNINVTLLSKQYRDRAPNMIRGRDLLSLVDKYGLRFGAMNMFHRYAQKDGTGILWFSMMGITDEGISPFDPHTVATNTYDGVVLFLSLPHPQALHSFDSMMSIAYLMADDLDAMILDENNQSITPEYKQQLRNQVRDYEG